MKKTTSLALFVLAIMFLSMAVLLIRPAQAAAPLGITLTPTEPVIPPSPTSTPEPPPATSTPTPTIIVLPPAGSPTAPPGATDVPGQKPEGKQTPQAAILPNTGELPPGGTGGGGLAYQETLALALGVVGMLLLGWAAGGRLRQWRS